MQHQYWVARRTVLRKLGSREDECVVSSDAELDAKLELFRSIAETSGALQRLIEQSAERAAALAREEAALGGFLREASAGGGGASRALAAAGKGVAYCGQGRSALGPPLARLRRELDTFRGRGVADTHATVRAVERARADYRAALSWMKAASARLDPDSGRGLRQFRKAQTQVRDSKRNFDRLTLDCLQKVDLLAAARCNMFSHSLVNYQNSMLSFAAKASHALDLTARGLSEAPAYDFRVLTELSQTSPDGEPADPADAAADQDRMLFFQDEFKDEKENLSDSADKIGTAENTQMTVEDLISADGQTVENSPSVLNPDLAGLTLSQGEFGNAGSFMPSQLLQELTSGLASNFQSETPPAQNVDRGAAKKQSADGRTAKKQENQKKDRAMWFKLFAELDPLANPDAVPGVVNNQSHAA